jgi:DNA primase
MILLSKEGNDLAGNLDIDDVLSKNDIVDIVSEYVPLKKKGANYVGLCPFHNDRNPSFMVSDTKQIFKCFSCGVGGNAIKFISLAEKLDFKDALYFLADKAGIDYQKNMSSDYEAKNKLKQDILSLNKATARFFHDSLNKSQKAIKYVNERKIAPEMVRKFGLGYSPEGWEALVNHFTSQGISHDLLLKAGLISSSNKNGTTR